MLLPWLALAPSARWARGTAVLAAIARLCDDDGTISGIFSGQMSMVGPLRQRLCSSSQAPLGDWGICNPSLASQLLPLSLSPLTDDIVAPMNLSLRCVWIWGCPC